MKISSKLRVLVVDDTPPIRQTVKGLFSKVGLMDVETAEDGLKAMEALLEAVNKGRPFDLIMADWNMPKMDGMELLSKVKSHPTMKKSKFVMLTAENQHGPIVDCVSNGVDGYIIKPISMDVLQGQLVKLFATK